MTFNAPLPRPLVAVIGGSAAPNQAIELAYQVGFELARQGISLVCGGGTGVMEAACRGLHDGRRQLGTDCLAVGILPGDDRSEANAYVDIALPTGMGIGRNILVVRAAQSVIAIGGETGTLSEIALAWQLGKRIVALKGAGGWAEELAGRVLDRRYSDPILPASTAAEAVVMALA